MTIDRLFNSFCLEGKITTVHADQIKDQLSEWEKEIRKETLKELILEFESNQLEGKGYDFYFAIRTKLDELLKDNKE
jgi:putative heme iron utilization protein